MAINRIFYMTNIKIRDKNISREDLLMEKLVDFYKKRLFDPFCRHSRIQFRYSENNVVITTIGQLNFFKWALKNGVIKYVGENLDKIKNDMLKNNKNRKKRDSADTSSEEQYNSES